MEYDAGLKSIVGGILEELKILPVLCSPVKKLKPIHVGLVSRAVLCKIGFGKKTVLPGTWYSI